MTDFKEFIQLAYEDSLDLKSTKKAFMQIMNGEISEIQISSFISLLQKSGVKSHHVIAALEVMRKKMLSINAPLNTMDTCGTGGCLLYTSPSPRDCDRSRMPSSA